MPDDLPVEEPERRLSGDGVRVGAPARDGHVWERSFRLWDAYFAVTYAATLVFVLGASVPGLGIRVAAAVLFTAQVPWYVWVGRPLLRTGGEDERRALVYIDVALLLFLPSAFMVGETRLAAFVLVPQCFMVLGLRRALLGVVVINLVPVVGWALLWRPASDVLFFNSVFAVVTLVFSGVFGTWISRIMDQSSERATLIAELDASREEVTRLSAERGALAERERLSREIHDTLAQGFTSLLMLVQAVESELGHDPAQALRHLRLMDRTARENLAEARALVTDGTPAGLDGSSLPDALRRLAARHAEQTGTPAAVEVTGAARGLPAAVEVVALRTCQEALANARRHAGPDACVTVALDYAAETLHLSVRDRGRGFPLHATSGGYGLAGIRSRAAEIGGAAEIRSAPGRGTEVTVTLPVGPSLSLPPRSDA
ncbi:sensor histidine kinase [Actinacidiphila oryziradicis]|uniref:sensor histidine kinase n=1 Tax=Actinacidiphila oryziradicis TaxID=2571141 RepID=UPI001FE9FEB8|nr:sensor histidine kinase [Actinacidiphila oryziradicis]